TDKAPGYSWVEASDAEVRSLCLTEGVGEEGPDDFRGAQRLRVAKARDKGKTVPINPGLALLFSRQCVNKHLTNQEREKKKFDFFVLTRDPEPDKAITGRHLIWAKTGEDQGWPVVHFRLNKVGGDLCYDLTSLNRPDEETGFKRHLAIILDGRIVSAPSISAPF